jgi:GTP-binding protein
VRQKVARTSAAPGKTRLANVYRVRRSSPVYFVDLPGYGYARGNADEFRGLAADVVQQTDAALLLVDARHPGLESDRAAWQWLSEAGGPSAVVATKIDKLGRGERIRALRESESVLETSVLPVSAVTGEGLDELWILIDRLLNLRQTQGHNHQPRSRPPLPKATAPHPPKN